MTDTGAFAWVGGGVTAAAGFLASGLNTGIKKSKKDLALILSEIPCAAAGVFTTNRVKAAPVLLTRERLAAGRAQAVVVNSGNANACTGPRGLDDARAMAAMAAEVLGVPEELVLVASTGVIGVPLPLEKLKAGIPRAAAGLRRGGNTDAAEAILTTDTTVKEAAVTFTLGGRQVTVGGMAKGSGMIHPNMATMLAFLTTDAAIAPAVLHRAFRAAADVSFNMISVDGDTSTNDMAVILANGLAGNEPITNADAAAPFLAALQEVCVALAKAIARDGEGATRLIEVRVKGAPTVNDARLAARAVAASNLVKAAVFGRDANWGRILCAAGYSGAAFDPARCDIFLGNLLVAHDGAGVPFDEEHARHVLAQDPVLITLDMKAGTAEAAAWGCDLTYDYVKINASYRS
ncbi:MAG: Arginine biosynthesis bifunctional protein ArgJ [Clostridia bacterium 62_21]|nr:MAG: Arginine biosynthesis bifunctional protein ArgJ [Clostridia bacterium 62_21]